MRNDQEISVGVFMSGCTPPGMSLAAAGTGAVGSTGKEETLKLAML
jgi:hypothetical protein